MDYIWFPWGIPSSTGVPACDFTATPQAETPVLPENFPQAGKPVLPANQAGGYGDSLRYELIRPEDYGELERRMAIFHTGITRRSADTNAVWNAAMTTEEGFRLHKKLAEIAYEYREGLRLKDWKRVAEAIDDYREIRTQMCPEYMTGSEKIHERASANGCVIFPLGAGGGGGVMVFAAEAANLNKVRDTLKKDYREISFRVMEKGCELVNL